jgi:hypothetical protein
MEGWNGYKVCPTPPFSFLYLFIFILYWGEKKIETLFGALSFFIISPQNLKKSRIPRQRFADEAGNWHHTKEHGPLPLNRSYSVLSHRNSERTPTIYA